MYDQLQKAQDIYNSVMYTAEIEAEARGKIEGKIEGEKAKALSVAQSLMETGMPIADISRHTGATEEEIRKLAH